MKPEIVKLEVSSKELDDIANGLGLLSASLKRAENAERDLDLKDYRSKQRARVLATIARLTNLPLDV